MEMIKVKRLARFGRWRLMLKISPLWEMEINVKSLARFGRWRLMLKISPLWERKNKPFRRSK